MKVESLYPLKLSNLLLLEGNFATPCQKTILRCKAERFVCVSSREWQTEYFLLQSIENLISSVFNNVLLARIVFCTIFLQDYEVSQPFIKPS